MAIQTFYDIQKINDFKPIVNKDTVFPLYEQGKTDVEILNIMADRVWSYWMKKSSHDDETNQRYCIFKIRGGFYPSVALDDYLKAGLPGRINNFVRGFRAEYEFIKELRALGYRAESAGVEMDYKGVDVVINFDYCSISVAVLADTPYSWTNYIQKYGEQGAANYVFAFEPKGVTQNQVEEWANTHIF